MDSLEALRDFPAEVIDMIIQSFDNPMLKVARQVCKSWNAAAEPVLFQQFKLYADSDSFNTLERIADTAHLSSHLQHLTYSSEMIPKHQAWVDNMEDFAVYGIGQGLGMDAETRTAFAHQMIAQNGKVEELWANYRRHMHKQWEIIRDGRPLPGRDEMIPGDTVEAIRLKAIMSKLPSLDTFEFYFNFPGHHVHVLNVDNLAMTPLQASISIGRDSHGSQKRWIRQFCNFAWAINETSTCSTFKFTEMDPDAFQDIFDQVTDDDTGELDDANKKYLSKIFTDSRNLEIDLCKLHERHQIGTHQRVGMMLEFAGNLETLKLSLPGRKNAREDIFENMPKLRRMEYYGGYLCVGELHKFIITNPQLERISFKDVILNALCTDMILREQLDAAVATGKEMIDPDEDFLAWKLIFSTIRTALTKLEWIGVSGRLLEDDDPEHHLDCSKQKMKRKVLNYCLGRSEKLRIPAKQLKFKNRAEEEAFWKEYYPDEDEEQEEAEQLYLAHMQAMEMDEESDVSD